MRELEVQRCQLGLVTTSLYSKQKLNRFHLLAVPSGVTVAAAVSKTALSTRLALAAWLPTKTISNQKNPNFTKKLWSQEDRNTQLY